MTTDLPSLPPRGDLRRRVLAGEPTIGAFVTLGAAINAELAPIWEGLRGGEWDWVTKFFAKEAPQAAWHQELQAAFRKLGLPLSRPFFNPPFEWLQSAPPEPTTQLDLTEQSMHRYAPLPMATVRRSTRARTLVTPS